MEQATFTCGHTASIPVNYFGRGHARITRIGTYFNRPCFACRCSQLRQDASRLTDTKANPLPTHKQEEAAARWIAKLQYHSEHK